MNDLLSKLNYIDNEITNNNIERKLIISNLDYIDNEKTNNKIERKLLISKIKDSCPHNKVVQAPFKPETIFSFTCSSFRVCEDCGLLEKDWEQYKILRTIYVREVTREEGFRIRNKFV